MRLKRAAAAVLALLLTAALAGCGPGKTAGAKTEGGLTVVTSFFPMYVTTINITRGVPGVAVVNMTQPQTGCLHDYQLTADDMKTLEKADVFVVNGAGMEAFMDKVIKAHAGIRVVEASAGISLVKDMTGAYNAHIWVSVTDAMAQVNNVAAGLEAADPAHKAQYEANAEAYNAKLGELKRRMHEALDNLRNRDIITMHEAFAYFASEFELNVAAVIEREPGTDPTPKDLAGIIDEVNALGIRALFAEPQYSQRAADAIARETGATVWALDPCVTGDATPENADAYINAMESNMKTLEEALK